MATLQRAVESCAVIDQAKSILIARPGVSADEALDMLCKQSQLTDRKLQDIATDFVAEAHRGEQMD